MISRLIALLGSCLFTFLLLSGTAAQASATSEPARCVAFSDVATTPGEMLGDPGRWQCEDKDWGANGTVAWLLFDADSWREQDLPTDFVTRIAYFHELSIYARDTDGAVRSVSYAPEETETIAVGPVFTVPLPEITDRTSSVAVRLVRPFNATILSEAKISSNPYRSGWSAPEITVMAMITGLLFLPLFANIMFYRALRSPFVLLHAAMVASMTLYVMTSGGLLTVFIPTSITWLSILTPVSFAVGVGISALFCASYIEPWALTPRVRRMLTVAAVWAFLVPSIFSLHIEAIHSFTNVAYYYSFVPVIAIYVVALVQSLSRGSRAAKFLTAAWAPIIVVCIERILRGVGLYAAPSQLDQLLFFALAIEVTIIATGVADRANILRQQRDNAEAKALAMADISEHDPLTGLYNRRAIEPRFDELYGEGFQTMAILDLDHFKSINDEYGHLVGDEVLRATAHALAPDDDTLVMRLGGEEFMMLLRGKDVIQRAEHRRRAVARHVASEVEGLDRIVTASMGLLNVPGEAMAMMEFRDLYSRADQLLYEAKQGGRNRMMSEELKLFMPDDKDPRELKRAA
ncbi:MAG TPA: diguanylate cyclase [Sphingomonadaceae bacterium]|nr:diguanylate cyclase [Sphingomonadaceae bacterium]